MAEWCLELAERPPNKKQDNAFLREWLIRGETGGTKRGIYDLFGKGPTEYLYLWVGDEVEWLINLWKHYAYKDDAVNYHWDRIRESLNL